MLNNRQNGQALLRALLSLPHYNINATKHGYWPDSNPVTVNASEPATADIVLCQKGDFNTNSESADAGDLAMMADATAAGTSDETYDLDGDGDPADENDRDTAERCIRGCGRVGVGGGGRFFSFSDLIY